MSKTQIDYLTYQLDSRKKDKENSLFANSLQSNESSASTKYRSNISNKLKDFCLDSSFNVINLLMLSSINEINSNCLFSINNSSFALNSDDDVLVNPDHGKYIYSCLDSFDQKLLDKMYLSKISSNVISTIINLSEIKNSSSNTLTQSTICNSDSIERENNINKTIDNNDNKMKNEIKIMSIGKKSNFALNKNIKDDKSKNNNQSNSKTIQSPQGIKKITFVKDYNRINSPKANSNQLKKKTVSKVSLKVTETKSPKKIDYSPSNTSLKTLSTSSKANNNKNKDNTIIINKKIDNKKTKSPKPSSSIDKHAEKNNQGNNSHMCNIQSFALNDNQKIISKSPSFIRNVTIAKTNNQTTKLGATYYQFKLKPTLKKNLNKSTDNIFDSNSKKGNHTKTKAKVPKPLNTSFIDKNCNTTSVCDISNDIFEVIDNTHYVTHDKNNSKRNYNSSNNTKAKQRNNNASDNNEFNEQVLRDEYRERITARFILADNSGTNERFSFNNSKCK